jgi:hypothetical protein
MKKNTYVIWKTKDGKNGFGQVITDEVDGHVQVAVHRWDGGCPVNIPETPDEAQLEVHPVIWCTTTWLTIVSI